MPDLAESGTDAMGSELVGSELVGSELARVLWLPVEPIPRLRCCCSYEHLSGMAHLEPFVRESKPRRGLFHGW